MTISDADSQAVPVFEGPRWLKICRQVYFWAMLIGGTGGFLFADFIPTELGLRVSLIGASALCIFGIALFCVIPPPRELDVRVGAAIVLAGAFFVTGFPITLSLLSIYTRNAGVLSEKRETVLEWNDSSTRSCYGPVVPHIYWYSRAICLSREQKARFNTGAPITIHGNATKFGINVDSVS